MEETNLKIKNIKYLTSMCYIRPDGIPTIIVSLFADYDSGEIKLCNALTEFAWVDLESSKKYELIDGIYEELKMLDDVLKYGKIKEWEKE